MAGSTPFSIEEASDNFRRSLKKLRKVYGDVFVEYIAQILENLLENPYPINSQQEPLPGKIHLPDGWTFHKLKLRISKGASGQIRLMYLVNANDSVIQPVWIYSHEQFVKRPADKDLTTIIQEILDC